MNGIKKIIYENDGQTLTIDIDKDIKIKYNDISSIISEEKFFEYIGNLFCIVYNWEKEYVNMKMIDGNSWRLSIVYSNDDKKEYSGKSSYPNNFKAFERLNQSLIDEVQNG